MSNMPPLEDASVFGVPKHGIKSFHMKLKGIPNDKEVRLETATGTYEGKVKDVGADYVTMDCDFFGEVCIRSTAIYVIREIEYRMTGEQSNNLSAP